MIGAISIDSTALRIPLEMAAPASDQGQAICNSEGRYIQQIQTIDRETGQVMHEHEKPNAQNFTDTDQQTGEIFTRYWIRAERHEGKDLLPCLYIGVHSKHLLHDYFEGITQATIAAALQTIINQGHFVFDISQAIAQGRLTQTDIKKDLQMSEHQYKQLCKELTLNTRESKYQAKTAKKWQHGIEWGHRESKKHYKTYHKSKQLLAEHPMFAKTYLPNMAADIVRFETKIAGAKDFKQLGFDSNQVETILKADQQQLEQIMHKQFSQVVNIEGLQLGKADQQNVKQTNTARAYAELLFECMTAKGYSQGRMFNILTNHLQTRGGKSKHKAKLRGWYNEWVNSKYQDFNNRHFVDEIFSK
jgi:hypothetical protein